MKRNTGPSDRILRCLIAMLIFVMALAQLFTATLLLASLILAMYFLATAIIGVCPFYRLLGIHTCPIRSKKFDVYRA